MRRTHPVRIIKACRLSFQGDTDEKVAKKLNVSPNTIWRWRKHDLWKQTEEKLIEKKIEQEAEKALKE